MFIAAHQFTLSSRQLQLFKYNSRKLQTRRRAAGTHPKCTQPPAVSAAGEWCLFTLNHSIPRPPHWFTVVAGVQTTISKQCGKLHSFWWLSPHMTTSLCSLCWGLQHTERRRQASACTSVHLSTWQEKALLLQLRESASLWRKTPFLSLSFLDLDTGD